jgi:hypothetical protein
MFRYLAIEVSKLGVESLVGSRFARAGREGRVKYYPAYDKPAQNGIQLDVKLGQSSVQVSPMYPEFNRQRRKDESKRKRYENAKKKDEGQRSGRASVIHGFPSPALHQGHAHVGLWNGQQSCSLSLELQMVGT